MNLRRLGRKIGRVILKAVRWITSPASKRHIQGLMVEVSELVDKVLPIVRAVTLITPTQADDAIVAMVGRLNLKLQVFIGMSDEEKSSALKAVAVALAREKLGALEGVPDHKLFASIDLAHAILKQLSKGELEALDAYVRSLAPEYLEGD